MPLLRIFQIPIAPNRIYGLDIMRAFAIMAVLLGHSANFIPQPYFSYVSLAVFDGVSIFFVLSGFLIGGILIKTLEKQEANWYTLLDFWIKRWFRTVPPYLLALFITMALAWNSPSFKLTYYKAYFVFLQNFRTPHSAFFGEAWSLSVEEWFYLLIPSATFLLINFRTKPKKALLSVAVFVLLSVTIYRYYKFMHFPPQSMEEWDLNFRKIVITRLDSLMYGVIAAYMNRYVSKQWFNNKGLKFLVGAFLLCFSQVPLDTAIYGLYVSVFSFSTTCIGTMLMLPYLSTIKVGTGWLFKCVTRISLISYSMYLLNFSIVMGSIIPYILNLLNAPEKTSSLVSYIVFWIITPILSILMYKYFETPFMQLRNKLIAPKSQSITPVPQITQ